MGVPIIDVLELIMLLLLRAVIYIVHILDKGGIISPIFGGKIIQMIIMSSIVFDIAGTASTMEDIIAIIAVVLIGLRIIYIKLLEVSEQTL